MLPARVYGGVPSHSGTNVWDEQPHVREPINDLRSPRPARPAAAHGSLRCAVHFVHRSPSRRLRRLAVAVRHRGSRSLRSLRTSQWLAARFTHSLRSLVPVLASPGPGRAALALRVRQEPHRSHTPPQPIALLGALTPFERLRYSSLARRTCRPPLARMLAAVGEHAPRWMITFLGTEGVLSRLILVISSRKISISS